VAAEVSTMRTPARFLGHPLHVVLVPLPLGLWTFALVADVAAAVTGNADWRTVALYTMGGGVAGALLAAVPGLIDLLSLRGTRALRTGVFHMSVNLAAVALFALNFFLRLRTPDYAGPVLLTVLGVALIAVSGWLGGQLVYVHGVGVDAAAAGEGRAART
jgi:uncharacterized membrane protein